jgi:hypothetical protein
MSETKDQVVRKTMQEILDETREFYESDPARRAYNTEEERCEYRTPDGRMCAVGRCLTDVGMGIALDHDIGIDGVVRREGGGVTVDNLLLPEYRGHPLTFWVLLQKFHDATTSHEREIQLCKIQDFVTDKL